MGEKDKRLRVVKGGRSKPPASNVEIWTCRTCEADTGVSSSAIVIVKLAPKIIKGIVCGGTQAYACAGCLSRGKITRVT